MPVVEVTTVEQFKMVLAAARTVVVDVHARKWCAPCRVLEPLFESASRDPANAKVMFLEIDADKSEELLGLLGVASLPTVQGWANGAKVAETVGASLERLNAVLLAARTASASASA